MTRLKYKKTENNILVGNKVFCTNEVYTPNIVKLPRNNAWIIINLNNEVVAYGTTKSLDMAKREVKWFLEGQGAIFEKEIRVSSSIKK